MEGSECQSPYNFTVSRDGNSDQCLPVPAFSGDLYVTDFDGSVLFGQGAQPQN